jgi:molecular chaperone GrpE
MTEIKSIKIHNKDKNEPNRAEKRMSSDSPQGQTPNSAQNSVDEKTPDDVTQALDQKLRNAEEDLKNTYDRLLRVSAEFENYKKRTSREMEEYRKYANEALISALLPAVDNLERAVESSKEGVADSRSLLEGVGLTLSDLIKILEKFHVKPIDAIGEAFDPNFHQAIMQEPSDEHPENTILQEMQKGYMIHNRLLRPSMVVVSKKE